MRSAALLPSLARLKVPSSEPASVGALLDDDAMPPSVLRHIEELTYDSRRGPVDAPELLIEYGLTAYPDGSYGFGTMSATIKLQGAGRVPADISFIEGTLRRTFAGTPVTTAGEHRTPLLDAFVMNIPQRPPRPTNAIRSRNRRKLTESEAWATLEAAIDAFVTRTDRLVVERGDDMFDENGTQRERVVRARHIKAGEAGFLKRVVSKSLSSEEQTQAAP